MVRTKILAMVLAVAMIVAIVPAFGLVASAAEIDPAELTMEQWQKYAGNPVFTAPNVGDDVKVSEAYGEGWSAAWNGNNTDDANGYVNINAYRDAIQVYGPTGSHDALKMPGYGAGKDFVIMEFWQTRPTGGENASFYHDFKIMDTEGTVIETGSISRTDGFYSGDAGTNPTYSNVHPVAADGNTTATKVSSGYHTGHRVIFVNNDDDTYSVIYYYAGNKEMEKSEYTGSYQNVWNDTAWKKVYTATYTGSFNGVGSIEYTVRGQGNAWYNNHQMSYLRIYAGDISDNSAILSELQKALTLEDVIVDSDMNLPNTVEDGADHEGTVTWESSVPSVITNGGNYTAPEAVTTVTLTATISYKDLTATKSFNVIAAAASRKNSTFDMNEKTYTTSGDNLITNGNIADLKDWKDASTGNDLSTNDWNVTSKYGVHGNAMNIKATGAGGNAARTMRRYVDLDAGTYYVSYYVYNEKTSAYGNMSATVAVTGSKPFGTFNGLTFKDYAEFGGHNSWSAESQSEVSRTRVDKQFAPGLNKVEYIITIPEGGQLLISYGAWTDPVLYLSDFEIYAAKEELKNVTINYKDGDETIKSAEVELGAKVESYVPTEKALVSGSDAVYYVTSGNAVAIEDGIANVPVTKLGNVFTAQNGLVLTNNLTDDGKYTGVNNFGAFNWSADGYDRVGVAILDVATDTNDIALSATKVRFSQNARGNGAHNGAINVELYAVSVEEFLSLDLSDMSAIAGLLTDGNQVAKLVDDDSNPLGEEITQDKTEPTAIALDAGKVKAAAGESGKVVILGNGHHTLYGLAGEGLEIVDVPGKADVSLGWNGENFTINVKSADASKISITPQDGTAVDVALGGNAGIAITPNSTNNVYTVAGKNGNVAGASVQASVYSLVAKALAEGGVDKAAYNGTNWISTKQVLAAAKVIADGGIYISGGQLTTATQKVLDYSNGTVTIKQDLYDAGLKFDTNATISAESADGDEISAVVTDARTITITGINGTALESIIYLEDVEFVLEAVDESVADETISGELDFVEEV